MDDSSILLFTAAVFLFAGAVKGVIGLGLPTVAIGLLGLSMPPAQAAAILIIPSLVTNIWQAAVGGHFGALARRLWPMLAGVVAGMWAGPDILTGSHSGQASVALGVALVIYAALGLSAVRISVPQRREVWLGPIAGLLTGAATAATGVFVVPGVPYLQALGLTKDELVQALGMFFTVSTVALAVMLARAGAMPGSILVPSAVALAAALIGMAAGQKIRGSVPERTFRLCFFIGLLVLGAHLALRGFF